MGDVSVIARRLKDGHVQYGWSGNGGYCSNVGFRLLCWYQNPEDVEYLFSLGQLERIGQKGSEYGGYDWFETHALTGEAFWLGTSEKEIFSKIAFVDYGYFYDLDSRWYYIVPGPFRIKMPLEFVAQNLDKSRHEFVFLRKVQDKILRYMFSEYLEENKDFADFLQNNEYCKEHILRDIRDKEEDDDGDNEEILLIRKLYRKYRQVFEYFDDWILLKTNDTNTEITDIVLYKNGCVAEDYDQSIFSQGISQGKLEILRELVKDGLLTIQEAVRRSGLSEVEFTKLLKK